MDTVIVVLVLRVNSDNYLLSCINNDHNIVKTILLTIMVLTTYIDSLRQ